ncbi:uncharacterized protein LOC115232539 isoform X2 [Octopus sinensis]|uniref:Uncharacterized protein LOC115232539 isoform X2 n=1 Tax=Octopus sinensis TaxID=2607531 RepID=A0A6P7UAE2_9MOLL|nr:uncharacterized protein LOC115232539 isoform X2 [Octopus sinensis]
MENFLGTWKQEAKAENMEALLAITDVTDKEKEQMTNMISKFEISQDGDKYTLVHTTDDPPATKSYVFALGEPLESTDILGRKFKSIFKLVNSNLLTETCSEWTEGVIDISYEITSSDTLKCSIQLKGITSTTIFKKVTS